MKILIAEDEYYARQRLIKIIRECDMEAELASAVENGREAVDFLEQNTDVDVVLTDIIMPRMNGLELAEYNPELGDRDTAVRIIQEKTAAKLHISPDLKPMRLPD